MKPSILHTKKRGSKRFPQPALTPYQTVKKQINTTTVRVITGKLAKAEAKAKAEREKANNLAAKLGLQPNYWEKKT